MVLLLLLGGCAVFEAPPEPPDVFARISAISAAIDEHPAAASCTDLPHGSTRARCERMAEADWLWTAPQREEAPPIRVGPGPARSTPWLGEWGGRFAMNAPTKSPCADEVDPHSCDWLRGMEAARMGQAEEASAACSRVIASAADSGTARARCHAMVAVEHGARWGRGRLEDTLALCGGARAWKDACVMKVVAELAARAPGVDLGALRPWELHRNRAVQISLSWENPDEGAKMVAWFWSESMRASVARAQTLASDAADHIPFSAWPHLRAALATEIVARGGAGVSLFNLAGRLEQTMAYRAGRTESAEDTPLNLPPVADMWPEDGEGEAHLSAVLYPGGSRRTVAQDPRVDARICVLEAAARSSPPVGAVLSQGLQDTDERVRWTAARLVERLGQKALQADADAMEGSGGEVLPG